MRSTPVAPTQDEADRRVTVRLKRQQLLLGPDAPDLWVILGEAALRREVGGTDVMADQLRELAGTARLPNVTVQVLPFTAGAHPSMQNGFVVLGFPEPLDPDVVYVEYRTGGICLEQSADIRIYETVFDHLRAKALSPEDSAALIRRIADEMSHPRC